MKFIGLFFPPLISAFIRYKRGEIYMQGVVAVLFSYIIYVLVDTWVAMSIVVYICMKAEGSVNDLERFSFFTKYIVIAMVVAVLIPYVEEVFRKYIEIKFVVRRKDECEKNGEAAKKKDMGDDQ